MAPSERDSGNDRDAEDTASLPPPSVPVCVYALVCLVVSRRPAPAPEAALGRRSGTCLGLALAFCVRLLAAGGAAAVAHRPTTSPFSATGPANLDEKPLASPPASQDWMESRRLPLFLVLALLLLPVWRCVLMLARAANTCKLHMHVLYHTIQYSTHASPGRLIRRRIGRYADAESRQEDIPPHAASVHRSNSCMQAGRQPRLLILIARRRCDWKEREKNHHSSFWIAR